MLKGTLTKSMAWQSVNGLASWYFILLTCATVYRVHWLKAKAQRDRWKEEIKFLYHEMDFCVNFMEHQEGLWNDRTSDASANSPADSGLHCYAMRQAGMWRTMAAQARQEFDTVRHKVMHQT